MKETFKNIWKALDIDSPEIRYLFLNRKEKDILAKNSKYRNIHKGERCFILCTGSSIASQNLLPLKNELSIGVSNFYHHKDYDIIKPQYHCIPQLTYTPEISIETASQWFNEMHSKIGKATLFLSISEEELNRKNNLFNNRTVQYVKFTSLDFPQKEIPDITKPIPGVQTVPVMAIMLAMYMGCSEIYLLGVDFDSFKTKTYKYFYEPTVLKDKDSSVKGGKIIDDNYTTLQATFNAFVQFRKLKNIAINNNINIFNATNGGELDEFERIRLENLFD